MKIQWYVVLKSIIRVLYVFFYFYPVTDNR